MQFDALFESGVARMETELNDLVWDDSLLVGVKQIDECNKYLFELINKAYAALIYHKQSDKANQIINELIDHVMYHFNTEEQSMKEHQYTGSAMQEQQHVYLVKMLILELDILHLNKIPTTELLEHFTYLLKNHIMTVDKQYAEHLKAAGNYCTKNRCKDSGATRDFYL